MGKIKCEWLDKQPMLKKEVKLEDGTVIGTVHATTREDKMNICGKSDNYQNVAKYSNWSIYYALIGHDCGWEFDREITFENILALPDDEFNAFAVAVSGLEKQNEITEKIVKN